MVKLEKLHPALPEQEQDAVATSQPFVLPRTQLERALSLSCGNSASDDALPSPSSVASQPFVASLAGDEHAPPGMRILSSVPAVRKPNPNLSYLYPDLFKLQVFTCLLTSNLFLLNLLGLPVYHHALYWVRPWFHS